MGLHDDFDNEQDLSSQFDNESDVVSGDKEQHKNDSLWAQISGQAQDVGHKLVNNAVGLAKLPGFIVKEAPGEWNRIKDNPASAGENAAKRFTQGASLLTIPEDLKTEAEKTIAGYAKHLPESMGGISEDQYNTLYNRPDADISAANKQHDTQLSKDFPISGMVSQGAGLAATTLAAGAAGVPARAALATQMLTQAGSKAYEENGGNAGQALLEGGKDALANDLTGLGITKAAGLAKSALSPSNLRAAATSQTLKSVGGTAEEISGMKNAPGDVAQTLSEQGIVGPGMSKPAIASKLNEVASTEGRKLENVVNNVSEELDKGPAIDTVDPTQLEQLKKITSAQSELRAQGMDEAADNLQGQIDSVKSELYGSPISDAIDNIKQTIAEQQAQKGLQPTSMEKFTVDQRLKQLDNMGGSNYSSEVTPTFKQLHQFKQDLGQDLKKAYQNNTNSEEVRGLKSLYDVVDKQLDGLAEKTSAGTQYSEQNNLLSHIYDAKKLSDATDKGVLASTMGLIKKYPAGAAGTAGYLGMKAATALGLPAMGAAAGLAVPVYLGAKYGRSAVAATLRGAANVSESVSDMVAKVAQQSPETFGRFAQPIQKAMERGPQAVAATSYMLSQQYPEYRDLLTKLQNQKKENQK